MTRLSGAPTALPTTRPQHAPRVAYPSLYELERSCNTIWKQWDGSVSTAMRGLPLKMAGFFVTEYLVAWGCPYVHLETAPDRLARARVQ